MKVETPPDKSILGDAAARTLFPVQALHSGGESFFALSLVGSLFFNVSVDAARPRILLYLAITMAPFAVLAPLIGPVIDRLRGGHRMVLFFSLGGRAIVAALLATQLKTLLLYPEAFVIVVLAKVYVVSRNALVPAIVDDRDHLVVVNSRLARAGGAAGVIAALIGLALLQVGGATWVLRAGAMSYGLGALAALRIPPPKAVESPSAAIETTEMSGPGIQSATIAMAGLRMATGFVFFHIGFALKTSGQATELIVAVAGAGAIGGLVGTFVAPQLRKRFDEPFMLTGALLVPAMAAGLAALRFHGSTAVLLSFSLGLAGSVGRRAFDSVVQTQAPHARRGRAFAGLETRLELAWVVGSVVAVIARSPDWLGLVALAVGLSLVVVDRIDSNRRTSGVEAEEATATLPIRLLQTADALALQGDRQQAVLVALAAADAADLVGRVSHERVEELQQLGRDAAAQNDPAAEEAVLRLAHELLTDAIG
ncbi:MAG: MFS family permease [Acidimicrobiales bacterium]|jgi:MFS family permease